MMRPRVSTITYFIMALLLLAIGCEDKPTSADSATGQGDIDLDSTVRVAYERADERADERAAHIHTDVPNAVHPIAKRSAFPEPGETFTAPIAAKKLSDENQFAAPIDPADIPDIVSWQQASQYVGHEITVQGPIVVVGQSRDGEVNFLNFHEDWRGKFYMVLFDDLAKTLDGSVEAIFKDKLVRVTGKVETFRGKPQIRITSMQQVEFVED